MTYTGTVDPTAVLLYVSGPPTGTLAPYLNLTVDIGADTADAYGTCTVLRRLAATVYTGTLAGFATNRTGYATGGPRGTRPAARRRAPSASGSRSRTTPPRPG